MLRRVQKMASVSFYGACGVVTGSCTLLEWGDTRLLIDCGLYQGDDELEARNWNPFPFEPSSLTAVLLTHAHLDHSGLLPRLVQQGFDGPIFVSKATKTLVRLILEDSAEIQEEQASYARRKGYSSHENPKPLYTSEDARNTLHLLEPLNFDEERELFPGIHVELSRAGHLLGAASITVRAKGRDGQSRAWIFSGDLGRFGVPILKDPELPPRAPDALLLESTYGDRLHKEVDSPALLGKIITDTFARGGSVVVPAFALGRTQEVLFHLAELARAGVIDPQDVFIDSPMAIDATEIYQRAKSEHDEELAQLVAAQASPLDGKLFRRCRKVEESKALNQRKRPAVIVAASGMANAGRVVHHLLHRLGDERTSVVFSGYQAAGTRGRALLDGASFVGIHRVRVAVKAEIHSLTGLSAHADQSELLSWCQGLAGTPSRVFLNHGEDPARKALAAALGEIGWPAPTLPAFGTRVDW
jgi:metallo-beta-lactamase family protein